jgi:transcriptional regulator with XRE-family HTH domain
VTPNQVVSWRLFAARKLRGWTQGQMVQELARHGVEWSEATYSNAERAVTGARSREFDADLVVALARATGFPVAWFYAPPEQDRFGTLPRITPRADRPGLSPDELVGAILGDDPGALGEALLAAADLSPAMRARVRRLFQLDEEGAT